MNVFNYRNEAGQLLARGFTGKDGDRLYVKPGHKEEAEEAAGKSFPIVEETNTLPGEPVYLEN